jgi:glycosyltransferase involved in cell wall biosynthesis
MAAPAPAKLILLSMVKNESRIVERLLGSVKGHVDAVVICDTGSTDNTIELVNRYLTTHEIPGTVYQYPFKNFGASRTQSFQCCQDWVAKQGWDAANTWALLLDGDMMLAESLDRAALAATDAGNIAGVSLKQYNGGLLYSNMRVLRCSEPWICKGATHEAWTCPAGKNTVLFSTPVLKDLGDGGCKSDKYERDVRLLKEDLAEMPNDARTHFYLGQTYLCLRDWPNAIATLKKRVELGGWDEENYIAQVYLGECYENSGDSANAVKTWLDAWQFRQHRTEAAIKLVCHLRKKPRSQFIGGMMLEKLFATQFGESLATGEKVGAPAQNNDVLFVNRRDIEYQLWEEMGILAFYTTLQRPTWLRTDALDLTGRLGWHDFNLLFSQMHWYDWCLKPRRSTRFQIPVDKLPWGGEEHAGAWQPFNPSIRAKKDGSGYVVNLRYANYYTLEAKHYAYRAFDGQVLTRNCLMTVPRDAGWNQPASLEEIKIDPRFKQDEANYIRGVEDCRLALHTDALEYMGTSRSYSDNGTNKIFHVWRGDNETTWSLRQLPLPPGVNAQETQKNWLPFRHGAANELLYIYSFSPFKICDAEGKVRVEVDTSSHKRALSLHEYRGSAGPAAWKSAAHPDEAYLCVMHKVYIGGDGRRYYHRFMTLDRDLRPSRVSCWVRMTKERVEYWSGLTPSIEGDSYHVVYGLKDSEAYIAELKTEDIEATLFYDMKADVTTPFPERLKALQRY